MPRFSEQMPAPLNYFTIILIGLSELHNLVNKSGLRGSFFKSRLGCTFIISPLIELELKLEPKFKPEIKPKT